MENNIIPRLLILYVPEKRKLKKTELVLKQSTNSNCNDIIMESIPTVRFHFYICLLILHSNFSVSSDMTRLRFNRN